MNLKWFVLFSAFFWIPVCASKKKIQRFERKLKLLESKLNLESMSRFEDISRLSDRLKVVEERENMADTKCCLDGQSVKSTSAGATSPIAAESPQNNILLKAFRDEKKENSKLRQKVSEIDGLIKNATFDYSSIRNAVDTTKLSIAEKDEAYEKKYATLSERLDGIMELFTKELKEVENQCQQKYDTLFGDLESVVKANVENLKVEMSVNRESKAEDCLSIYINGARKDGVYEVYPLKGGPVRVYCDMTTDGGGWTVFQRRQDGSENFERNWDDYKQGFGDVTGEFWLGNDHIAALSSGGAHELRIELEDFDGGVRYAKYNTFKVLPESDNYKLAVGNYSGDAGDSFTYHNDMQFSTIDRDNDDYGSGDCAEQYHGGWWYNSCHDSNLNGLYLKGPGTDNSEGVNWQHWLGWTYSLKMTEMKLR